MPLTNAELSAVLWFGVALLAAVYCFAEWMVWRLIRRDMRTLADARAPRSIADRPRPE